MSLLFRLLLLTSCLLLAPTALAEPAPLRLPHPELVGSVAFSPDGKTLATGCHDDILRVWDVATGKERWRVRSPQRNASVVDISPDGKLVASVSMVSDRISLWDAATGKEVRAIDAGSRGVHHIAFSPDGRLLASAGGDWALAVWDVRTGNRLRHLTGHGGQVLRVVFSPDGKTLVSASQDRTARLWDIATGKELHCLAGHRGWIYAVAFSPDGNSVASADTRTLYFWNARTGRLIGKVDAPEKILYFYALSFSPDSRTLASVNHSNAVCLWEVATGEVIGFLPGHTKTVCAADFSRNGLLASGASDNTAVVQDWRQRARLAPTPRARGRSADGERLWRDLAGPDATRAYRTIARLASEGDEAVSFLKKRLRPVTEKDAAAVRRLVADLEHARFVVREKATKEIRKLGTLARPVLEAVLEGKPSLEARRRIEGLLGDMEDLRWPPEVLQQVRSVQALEMIGTRA